MVGPNYCFDPEGTVLDDQSTDMGWLASDSRSAAALLNEDQHLVKAMSLAAAPALLAR